MKAIRLAFCIAAIAATILPLAAQAQQAHSTHPPQSSGATHLEPAISQWTTVQAPELTPADGVSETAMDQGGLDLTSETVAIIVVAVILAVVIVRNVT